MGRGLYQSSSMSSSLSGAMSAPGASGDGAERMERGEATENGRRARRGDVGKGVARARRYVEMPVPDVNAKRTVNTYDPEGQRLVSVWAANYTARLHGSAYRENGFTI